MPWIIGAAILGGGIVSGIGSSSAADTAASANAANTAATNAQNYQMFLQSRGSPMPGNTYGNSILPNYFGANEQNSANSAYAQFQQLSNANQGIYNQMQGQLGSLQGAYGSSLNALGGLYNGQNLQQQLGFNAPVFGANTALAQTTGQGLRNVAGANTNAINTGLAQQLAMLNAQNARQGFLGNSSFNQNQMLASTIGAHQQAAVGQAQASAQANVLTGQAQLQNVQGTSGLQMQNLANMTNPGLITQGLNAYNQGQSAPLAQSSANYQAAQAPLNFYRIGPQSWQAQSMPTVYPQINAGQIAGSALQSGANAYGQYSALQNNNALISQLMGGSGAGYTSLYNPGGSTNQGYPSYMGAANTNALAGYGGAPVTSYGGLVDPYAASGTAGTLY